MLLLEPSFTSLRLIDLARTVLGETTSASGSSKLVLQNGEGREPSEKPQYRVISSSRVIINGEQNRAMLLLLERELKELFLCGCVESFD
jgi:hypothetical protein